MIDSSIMNLMMELATFSFIVPLVLIIVWKLRTRKSLIPVFIGAGIFFVFAYVLEAIPHTFFLRINSPVSTFLTGNPWAYALYGGIMAALFEETGRYIAFRIFLKNQTERETAVSYGLGHGGIECIIVLGLGHLQNYTYCQLINNGQMDKLIDKMAGNDTAIASYQSIVDSLSKMNVYTLMLGGLERVAALFLQIALSVLVFYAVRKADKIKYLWIAMGIHALVDFIAAFYRAGIVPLLVVELCIVLLTAGACKLAYQLYQSLPASAVQKKNTTEWAYAKQSYKKDTNRENKQEE